MNIKKSEKANLEDKRTMFIQIGLAVTLALVLLAFEWRNYDSVNYDLGQQAVVNIEEDIILNTEQNEPPPPPPPEQQTTILNIVDDDVEVKNDVEINAEADQKTAVKAFVPVIFDEPETQEAEIFTIVEENPTFPGGDEARIKFLQNNIVYPVMAKESGIQGTVYVTFVVEKDGNVTAVKILRGIGGGCDEEAVRVIKAMPKWQPGKQRNKPVRVQFNMPIKFTLAG